MAIQTSKSALGEIKGSVGNDTIYKWRSLTVIRQRSRYRDKNKISPKQHQQNNIFKLVTSTFHKIQSAIKVGYQQQKNTAMTPMNAAVSYHMLNAIVGDPQNLRIDPAKIKISHSIWATQNVWKPSLVATANKQITVTWELNPYPQKSTRLDDKVVIQLYHEDNHHFYPCPIPLRDALVFNRTLNNIDVGKLLHCYMFVVSANGKLVSPTVYLGTVTVLS